MRCNPLRWLWGLIPILMLTWITVLSEQRVIEADLSARTKQAFEAAGFGWADGSFNGRDGALKGQVSDDAERDKIEQIARNVWGVREVDSNLALIAKAERYVWSANNRERRVKLHGSVPNDQARRDIVGMAKATFPGSEIDDQMKLARGVPDLGTWLGGVSFGLKQLAGLKRGELSLERLDIALSGEALDPAAFKSVKTALASGLPKGISLKSDAVTAPAVKPFTWSAQFRGGELVLAGHVPNDAIRGELITAATRNFTGATLVDRMATAGGAPDGWPGGALLGLRELARLEEGAVELSDVLISIGGVATDEAGAVAIRDALQRSLPQGYKVREQITFRSAAVRTVSPYTTAIVLEGDGVVLQGYVPSDAIRGAIVASAKARFQNRRLTDRLEVAAGANDGYERCLEAGVQALSRLASGRLELVDRKLVIAGMAADEATSAQIGKDLTVAAARLCDLDNRISFKQDAEPALIWAAIRNESQIILEGDVPDQAIKVELAKAAARLFVGVPVVDRQRVVNIAPASWARTAEAGLKSLSQLRSGQARLEGPELLVTGLAADATVVGAIRDRLGRDLTAAYRGRETIEVRSDAMIWAEQEARKKAAEEQEARRRQTADLEARRKADQDRQRAEAEAARRKAEEDRQRAIADAEAARRKVEDDRRRAEAEALRRKTDEDRQRADAEAARRKAEDDRKRQEAEVAARARTAAEPRAPVTPGPVSAEVKSCQDQLSAAARDGVILFNRASADLDRQSVRTLSEIAMIARRCPNVVIEVEGHTDSEGIPERNQPLSERRAQAVVDYLSSAGVEQGVLVAIGYGDARPVATNDTAEGKAKNRRIDFTVKSK